MKSMSTFLSRTMLVLALSVLCLSFFAADSQAKSKNKKESAPFNITYDGKTQSYTGVQGMLKYHHKDYTFQTLPVIKINSTLYAPAEELIKTVWGFDFSYDESLGSYRAYDEDTKTAIIMKAGESSVTIEKNGQPTSYSLSKAITMVQKESESAIPCIPLARFISAMGYTGSWDGSSATYTMYRSLFFDWNGTTEDTDTSKNHINRATGEYSMFDNMAYIDLNFYGDRQASFDSVSVDRSAQVITITLPDSTFLPDLKMYDRFGDIVERMVVSEEDGKVTITIYCADVTEFTYTTFEKHLHFKLLWDYSTSTGQEFNYSFKFTRPDSSYLIDSIKVDDCYDSVKYTKAFKIFINGDHYKFYTEHPPVINNDYIKKYKVSTSSGGNTVIKITTKTLQGYKIDRIGDEFLVTLDKPRKIFKNILVFDCGHGDFDNGASHYGIHEKNLNLNMGYTILHKYFRDANPKVKVYWTRMNDSFVTLDDRSKFAKKVGADAFVSLHMNSADNKKANGTEVYYSTSNNKSSFSGIKSSIMASMMDTAIVNALKTVDRGVKSAGFYVIKRNSVPAILIELCFLSGDKDHKRVNTTSFKNKASKTIAGVIDSFFKKYPTKR